MLTKELFEEKCKDFQKNLIRDLDDDGVREYLSFILEGSTKPVEELDLDDAELYTDFKLLWAEWYNDYDPFFRDYSSEDDIDAGLKDEIYKHFCSDTIKLYMKDSVAYLLDELAFTRVYKNVLAYLIKTNIEKNR